MFFLSHCQSLQCKLIVPLRHQLCCQGKGVRMIFMHILNFFGHCLANDYTMISNPLCYPMTESLWMRLCQQPEFLVGLSSKSKLCHVLLSISNFFASNSLIVRLHLRLPHRWCCWIFCLHLMRRSGFEPTSA